MPELNSNHKPEPPKVHQANKQSANGSAPSLSNEIGNIDTDDWISVSDAAKLRGVVRQTIYDLIAIGKLQTSEIFGRSMPRRKDVEAYDPCADKGGRPRKADSVEKETKKRK